MGRCDEEVYTGGIIGSDVLTIPVQSQTLLGKAVSALVSADTAVLADGTVVGTLRYVTDYAEYDPGNVNMQKGNFFPVKLTKNGETLKTNVSGTEKEQAFPDDNTLVVRIPSEKTTVKISVDDSEIVTLNFKAAILKKQADG